MKGCALCDRKSYFSITSCFPITIFLINKEFLSIYSYAFFHATRKTFSNVKSTISSEWSGTIGNESHLNRPEYVYYKLHFSLSNEPLY